MTMRPFQLVLRNRQALMMSTALQAAATLMLALPTQAQPAPNARPTGGMVVGGSAAINQTANNTQINQSTQRAAINWKSFDVGRQQSVTFNQPNASAVALNRVTGPDPSQIAGRIDANGQIILINQSGVNFYKGAQVNTAGLIVTTANMTDKNFMAGGALKFDQPGGANAKIDNQGTITIKQAGLAALVAPQVANSGVISAKLGHVVLAGAQTATVDLYGDGLLSLDVTNQVTQVPVDKAGNKVTALVTNSGVVVADGGTVQLTAAAADGIVQNLVQAGGTIRAATVADHTGTIALNGVGGSIMVEGQVAAPGSAPGTKGGAIEAVSDRGVQLTETARVDASGPAGGGTVALGTTVARARGGSATRTAARTAIAAGATITANATALGDGGRVVVLSDGATEQHGDIAARGGAGGAGGFIEVSGKSGYRLDGPIDVSGTPQGRLLIDPSDLTVTATTNSADSIAASYLSGLSGAIELDATHDLRVSANLSVAGNLSLLAGHRVTVDPGTTVTGANMLLSGGVTNFASNDLPQGEGGVVVNGTVQATHTLSLFAGTDGIVVAGSVLAPDLIQIVATGAGGVRLGAGSLIAGGPGAGTPVATLDISTPGIAASAVGSVTQDPGGAIIATTLQSQFGIANSLDLPATGNRIATINGAVSNPATGESLPFLVGGDFNLSNATALQVVGTLQAGQAYLTSGTATAPGDKNSPPAYPAAKATVVPVAVAPESPSHAITLKALTGDIKIGGTLVAGTVSLAATAPDGNITETGAILANTLTGQSGASTTLKAPGNHITDLGAFTSGESFSLIDSAIPIAPVPGDSNAQAMAWTQMELAWRQSLLKVGPQAPQNLIVSGPVTAKSIYLETQPNLQGLDASKPASGRSTITILSTGSLNAANIQRTQLDTEPPFLLSSPDLIAPIPTQPPDVTPSITLVASPSSLASYNGSPLFSVPRADPVQTPPASGSTPPPSGSTPPPSGGTPPNAVAPTSAGTPVPNVAETSGDMAPSGTEVAEAAYSAMCETPAGKCPQRSYTPIIVGSTCTCSDAGKIYSGVIRLPPSK